MTTAPLRIGVLGTGRITRKVGPAIARTAGAELAAVGSRDAAKAAAWAGEFHVKRSHGSYAALLADPDLDAVYVALPPGLHREWTVKAAERGLHVLCEKPLAPTLAEAAEMADACRAHGVRLMDGVMWVHTPRAAAMLREIASGALGPLRRVTSAFTFRPDDWTAAEHRLNPALGGGGLLDQGWYCAGLALWAFGSTSAGERAGESVNGGPPGDAPASPDPSPPLLPEAVYATAELRDGVDLSLSALLRFPDGRTSGFDCGFTTAARRWVEFAGPEGSLVCDDFVRARDPAKTRFWTHGRWGESREVRCVGSVQEDDLIAAFVRHVRSEGPADPWAEFSLAVQRVCEAVRRSALSGEVVEVAGHL